MRNIFVMIITLTVGVILAGALLAPVIDDVTTTERTLTNSGLFEAVALDENSSHTLVFDYTDPNTLTIDGTDIDMSAIESPYSSATVVFSNDWFLRFSPDVGVILYKCGTSSAQAIKGATASSQISVTITIASGTATFTYSDSTVVEYTIAGAGLMITSGDGSYVMKSASDKAYVNKDSIVYGAGRTDKALGTSGTSFNAMISASIEDGVTLLYYSPQYTVSDNSEVSYTPDNTYVDIYELSGFTFNLVSNDEVEHPVTYNQIFVPKEVTSELAQHLDDGEIAMMEMIPIMVIICLVMAMVGYLVFRSRD